MNSGTVSRPPVHLISLMVDVEQTHVTPVLFDRKRTGHDSRRLVLASTVARHTQQTNITENNVRNSDVKKRRSISSVIISVLKHPTCRVEQRLSCRWSTSDAVMSLYFTYCYTPGISFIVGLLQIEQERLCDAEGTHDSVRCCHWPPEQHSNQSTILEMFMISQYVAHSFFVRYKHSTAINRRGRSMSGPLGLSRLVGGARDKLGSVRPVGQCRCHTVRWS